MSRFKELVHKHLHTSSTEDMERLTALVDNFVENSEQERKDLFLIKIDLLLNPHFTEDTAKFAVSKMKNKDGSSGDHWSYADTTAVLEKLGYDFCKADWYVTLNMMYSDYYKESWSTDIYVDMAKDFIDDVDAPDDKVKRYWLAMNY